MLRRLIVLLLLSLAAFKEAQSAFSGAKLSPTVFPARKRALVIGVRKTEGMAALKYAVADARGFAALLRQDLDFKAQETRLLTTEDPKALPTRARILQTLDELLADPSLQKGELFVFYFSGHGVGRISDDFLLPSDGIERRVESTGIPLNDVLARISARGLKNVLLIADACRAGEKSTFGTRLVAQIRKTNVALLLGCAPGNRSYEYPELGHGVFTHFLLKSIDDPKNLDEYGAL